MSIARQSKTAGAAIIAALALVLGLGSWAASAADPGQGTPAAAQPPAEAAAPSPAEVPAPAAALPADVDPAVDAALRERVDARWQALIAGDFQAAYGFELPSYRERTPYATYRSQFGSAVAWHVVTISQVEYDSPEVARVRVAIDHSFLPSGGGSPIRSVSWLTETWLRREGQWWYGGPR